MTANSDRFCCAHMQPEIISGHFVVRAASCCYLAATPPSDFEQQTAQPLAHTSHNTALRCSIHSICKWQIISSGKCWNYAKHALTNHFATLPSSTSLSSSLSLRWVVISTCSNLLFYFPAAVCSGFVVVDVVVVSVAELRQLLSLSVLLAKFRGHTFDERRRRRRVIHLRACVRGRATTHSTGGIIAHNRVGWWWSTDLCAMCWSFTCTQQRIVSVLVWRVR